MGRPSKINREEAIEHVMNAIWRDGYEACSIKAISEQLGITRSSFYHAFKSREELFIEAMELYSQKMPTARLFCADEDTKVLELLTETFKELCKFLTSQPEARGCMIVNSVTELVGVDPILGPILENSLNTSKMQFEKLLSQALQNGEIPSDDNITAKALALQNLLIGLNVMSKVVTSEKDLWAVAQETLKGLGLYSG